MSDQPELICNRCQELQAENERLREEVDTVKRAMSAENSDLAEELAGARGTIRTIERQNRGLKAELTKVREEGPLAEHTKIVLNCWVQALGHKRADVSMSGDRAKLVMSMLRRRHCGSKNVEQQAFTLCRAIRGVGLKPYKLFNDRYTIAPPDPRTKLLTQLEHCIGDDSKIEENVDVYRRACKAAVEKREAVIRMWERISALESELAFMVTAPLAWFEQGADEENIEQYLWERLTVRDREWAEIIAPERPTLELAA